MTTYRIMHLINQLGASARDGGRLVFSGGAEQQLVANLRRFSHPSLRHHLLVFDCLDLDALRSSIPAEVEVTVLPSGPKTSLSLADEVRSAASVVRRHRPDLLHCSLASASLVTRIVGAATRVPVLESLVNIAHDPIRVVDNPHVSRIKLVFHGVVDAVTMRSVTHFHALSEAVVQSWTQQIHIPSDRVSVIARGVDLVEMDRLATSGITRAQLLSSLGIPLDAFVVLNVGRCEPQKGQRYLLEATATLMNDIPNLAVLIAGRPGNSSTDIENRITRLGLTRQVRLLGRRGDVPSLMHAADAFVFPSLFEGLGVSLLQAMGSGLACVATDAPPMNGVITDEITGLLVPRQDSESLARSVTRLARDSDLRKRLGVQARAHIAEHYSAEAAASAMETLYLRILEPGIDAKKPTRYWIR